MINVTAMIIVAIVAFILGSIFAMLTVWFFDRGIDITGNIRYMIYRIVVSSGMFFAALLASAAVTFGFALAFIAAKKLGL